MSNKYLDDIKTLVLSVLKEKNVKIVLFGSRARNDNNNRSDVDIAIIPKDSICSKELTSLKEKINELNVPYKVEVINFNETSSDFQKEIMKDAVVWKE